MGIALTRHLELQITRDLSFPLELRRRPPPRRASTFRAAPPPRPVRSNSAPAALELPVPRGEVACVGGRDAARTNRGKRCAVVRDSTGLAVCAWCHTVRTVEFGRASVGTQTEELDGDPSAYRILWDRAEKDTNLSASATPSASTDEGTETPTAADFAATARLVLSVLRVRRVFRERVARTRAQAEWDKMEDIEEGDEGEDKEDKDEKEKKKIQVMSDLDLGVKERATEMEPVEGTAPSLTDPMGVDTDRSGPAEVTEPAGKTELGEPTGLRGRTEDTEPTPTATRLLSKSFLLPLTAARRRALSMASLGSNLAAFMSTATLVDEPESILPSPSPSPSSPSSPMLSGSRSSTMRSSTASSFSEALTASVSTEFEFNGGASSATLFIEQADVQVQTEEYKVSFSHQGDEDGDGFARSIKGDCLDAANIKTTQTTRTITRLVLGGVQRVRKSDA